MMAEVLLFHHALGLTPGCLSFADELRAGGHVVHAPDLYEGRTFDDVDAGVGYAQKVGFDIISERASVAAEGLPTALVYAGLSLGVMPAQRLAQTRSGARGALLISAAVPPSEFGGDWPEGVPLQIHMMEDDEFVRDEGDLDVAHRLVEAIDGAALFLYPGDKHLFVDNSLPDYDEAAATQVKQEVLSFLDAVG
jgi:dienelactone hydrolase